MVLNLCIDTLRLPGELQLAENAKKMLKGR